jgi:hypothetical protein
VTAPVQVLVIGFDPPAFSGEVLAELTRLWEAGIVRLVDLLLVERREDGTLETLDAPGGLASGSGAVAAAILCDTGDGPADEAGTAGTAGIGAWSLADVVPPGSVAAVALIEHLWAAPLTAAIGRVGGTPLEEAWLAAPEREAMEAMMEARVD